MTNWHELPSQAFDLESRRTDVQPLTAVEVRNLLTRPETVGNITTALRRTNTQGHRLMGRLLGQELGFVAFGNLTRSDRSVHVGPLWEGAEGSIEMHDLAIGYLAENPDLPRTVVFDFHTHTHLYIPALRELIADSKAQEIDDREIDILSHSDLKSFFYELIESPQYPFRIRALGTERDGKGRIILVAFNTQSSQLPFTYTAVYERSIEYLKTEKDPLDAYREAGLNVATIDVDLDRDTPMDIEEVTKASEILTRNS